MENKSRKQELEDKYRAKIKLLDERMEELKKMPLDDAVEEEMDEIMRKTNRYLRAMGADRDEMYDL